ncbi:MAG TPA: P1 family peptidase [Ornithinimicrobium sp.]|nr:P1 family peptidase [Ornithinimicrobium sp.]
MRSITDVAGVRVGHLTLSADSPVVRTGVTCVLPHDRDLLVDPVPAAVHVVNGYGKPVGLSQVAELGELEAPVLLTGTFGVGAAHEGAVRELLGRHPDLGLPATANPVVLECNDGRLSDLRALPVRPPHAEAAVAAARAATRGHEVEQGAVGAGTGMVAFGWKGGIGTSSVTVPGEDAPPGTLGALVLTNMGRAEDLVVRGRRVGGAGRPWEAGGPPRPATDGPEPVPGPADGSVVVLLATDARMDSRQLGRLARRAQNGLARTGVPTAHGSGEFVLAWSTAATSAPARRDGPWMTPWFDAVAEVVEDAVLASLRHARTTTGRDGVLAHRCPHV